MEGSFDINTRTRAYTELCQYILLFVNFLISNNLFKSTQKKKKNYSNIVHYYYIIIIKCNNIYINDSFSKKKLY